jgi:hypothetical protein
MEFVMRILQQDNTTTKPLNQNNMKQNNIKINNYIPLKPNIARMKRWWKNQSVHNDKGGSFNVSLYLDYLNAINQQ